jgi:hypothetical protein
LVNYGDLHQYFFADAIAATGNTAVLALCVWHVAGTLF